MKLIELKLFGIGSKNPRITLNSDKIASIQEPEKGEGCIVEMVTGKTYHVTDSYGVVIVQLGWGPSGR